MSPSGIWQGEWYSHAVLGKVCLNVMWHMATHIATLAWCPACLTHLCECPSGQAIGAGCSEQRRGPAAVAVLEAVLPLPEHGKQAFQAAFAR